MSFGSKEAGVEIGDTADEDVADVTVVDAATGCKIFEGGEIVVSFTPPSMIAVGDLDRTLRGSGKTYTHCLSVVMQLTQLGRPSSH